MALHAASLITFTHPTLAPRLSWPRHARQSGKLDMNLIARFLAARWWRMRQRHREELRLREKNPLKVGVDARVCGGCVCGKQCQG